MAFITQQVQDQFSPKTMTYLLFGIGLLAIAYGFVFQQWVIAMAAISLPLILLILIYSFQSPRFILFLYIATNYYLTVITRYSRKDKLSVILDIILVCIFVSILVYSVSSKKKIRFLNSVNILTISYIPWGIFCIVQILNPIYNDENTVELIRGWLLGTPIAYFVCCLLLDQPKVLKKGLIILGLFTLTAFVKLLWQKFRWFDAAETEWLMQGSAITHILSSGIRYFSIFSDAGNFGSNMGMVTIVYAIVGVHVKEKWLQLFFLSVAVMGAVGLLLSGTRGAIIVPFGGLALYCFLSKSIKIMSVSVIIICIAYAFFTFTDIGDENAVIRRMRTAFKPNKDTSFQVRLENQKLIAHYMKDHPLGAGIGGGIKRAIDTENPGEDPGQIPPDSAYVDIWIQTGTPGLVLYIAIYVVVLLRCCYLVMFRIRNKELKQMLAALLCGVFGLWLNGYVGRGMTMKPSGILIIAALAFILNGPYMDKQLSTEQNSKL